MPSAIDTISTHLGAALLVVFRVSGLAIFAPVLGSPVLPMRVKALLVFLLGLAAYPTLAAGPLSGTHVPLSLGSLAPLIVLELLIGALVGFMALMPIVAMQMGGMVMSQQMGLGFARVYNPAMEDEGDSVEQAFFFFGLGAFLAMGGLEQMVVAVTRSFEFVGLGGAGRLVAVGGFGLDSGLASMLTGLLLAATELALRVSAPLIAIFMIESVAMGFLSKSMPALNLLTLGFPLRIVLGFAVIVLAMGVMGEALAAFTEYDLDLIRRFCVFAHKDGTDG